MSDYTIGRQPCVSFTPSIDGNAHAMWANVHECIFCRKSGDETSTVSFCTNCSKDHHSDGYETCKFKPTDRR